LFYNPNIQPVHEYEFRKKELERIAEMNGWEVIYPPYEMDIWFKEVKGRQKDPERGARCSICFNKRLRKVFEYAEKKNFDVVASTLSISPYKVTKQINEEGEKLSREFGIRFLPENFKKQNGFAVSKKVSMEMGIKHQDYCGCVFSLVEKKLRERVKRSSVSGPKKRDL